MPLFAELRRRNVVRVAVLYVVASWVILQAADVIFGVLDVPKWAAKLVLALLVLGFPVALVLSWIYEITPEGVQRQRYAARGSPGPGATARKLDVAIAVMAAIAIVGIVVDRLIPERPAAPLAAPAPPVAPSAIAARSIAVLPFVDMSQSKDQEYFADGLSEELMNLLTPVQGLRVIGRTSSFQFKGRNEDLRTIGEVLNVAHILEGSVRKSGETLRISAKLIRAADGSQLWAATYDRRLDDIFALQDEIAAAVVGALKMRLVASDPPIASPRRDIEAYNQYLQGRFHLELRTPDSLDAALAHFRAAVERDPGDAFAWVGLSETYLSRARYTAQMPLDEAYRLARQAALRALALDSALADAHAVMGLIQQTYDWDWAAADASFERALQLAPKNPNILSRAAGQDETMGRRERAIERFKQTLELDPLRAYVHYMLARVHLAQGRNADAAAAAQRAVELAPKRGSSWNMLALTHLSQGKLGEAERANDRESAPFWRLYGTALIRFAQGRRPEADAALKALIDEYGEEAAYQIAEVYAFRGEPDLAFQWLDHAYRQRDGGLSEIYTSSFLGALRSDQRYAALIERLGLPAAA